MSKAARLYKMTTKISKIKYCYSTMETSSQVQWRPSKGIMSFSCGWQVKNDFSFLVLENLKILRAELF